jgi:DNA-binding TFAR19-related protein (PDSD5 family)
VDELESAKCMTDELERIKLKKMEELRKQIELKQKMELDKKKSSETKKKVLVAVLEPAALQYFEELKKRDVSTANEIENLIMRLVLNQQLKYKLDQLDLEALERRIKGVEPKITIKRRGSDEIDLTEKLKEDADERN